MIAHVSPRLLYLIFSRLLSWLTLLPREASDQRGEHGPIGPVQAGLGVGSAQYRDLVA